MIKFSEIPQFPTSKHRETVALNEIPQWIEKQKKAAIDDGLTNKQKEALAFQVMSAAGNIVEFGTYQDSTELADVNPEIIKEQLAKWMKMLPGNVWDLRLGD
ncbi:MAG TPA: hypothetical protein PKY82_35825 [Pyrinomonadaceae bacterium]|nr:hypothetical protein [Pyrinomonadaceae bacterium]